MAPFKFDSASCFLTYPQSSLESLEIAEHLKSLADIDWARICQEKHKDGERHQHVVCKWKRRVQSRNARVFDIKGFHPNIQPIRSIKHALTYVSKDGEFIDIGSVPAERDTNIDWVEKASSLSEADYFKLACKERLSYQYAQRFWELGSKNATTITESYEPDLSRETSVLNLTVPSHGSTVIIGPSGIGKTSWAKRVCTKPGLWVRHIDVLRSFKPEYHKSVIFDDMSFLHLPRETQIQLTDQTDEAHIHCRYGVAKIPAQTQKIFTANTDPFIDDPAINRRITKINLY